MVWLPFLFCQVLSLLFVFFIFSKWTNCLRMRHRKAMKKVSVLKDGLRPQCFNERFETGNSINLVLELCLLLTSWESIQISDIKSHNSCLSGMHSAFECYVSVQDFWLNWGSSLSSQTLWANQCPNYSQSPRNKLSMILPGVWEEAAGEKCPSLCRQLWHWVHQLGV